MGVAWSEIVCPVEVTAMLYECTYCVFTLYNRNVEIAEVLWIRNCMFLLPWYQGWMWGKSAWFGATLWKKIFNTLLAWYLDHSALTIIWNDPRIIISISYLLNLFYLKALSVILNSKLNFIPNPQIFLHIQEEIHYNKIQVEQFPRKQHIFGKADNFLLMGINYRQR